VSRAANVMVQGNCTNTTGGGTGCDPLSTSLGHSDGLTDGTPAFTTVVRFYNQSNQYMKAMICWQRSATDLPAKTLEFGVAIPDSSPSLPTCDTPAPASAPLLLYFPSTTPGSSGFTIKRDHGPDDYNYRGSAWVVTNGMVKIEERLQTCLTTTAGSPCLGHQFTRESSLTVMTWGGAADVCAGGASCGNMNLADETSNVDRIMGLFYAGCDPGDTSCSGNSATKGILRSRKQTNTVGMATGYRLCFAGGSSPCPGGGNVPSFFQVIPDTSNLTASISLPTIGSFTVGPVPRYWVECKPADGGLPTGLCSYTP